MANTTNEEEIYDDFIIYMISKLRIALMVDKTKKEPNCFFACNLIALSVFLKKIVEWANWNIAMIE